MKRKANVLSLTIVLYALLAVKQVWLAFDSVHYSFLLFAFTKVVIALCVVLGMLGIITKFSRQRASKWLLLLPFIYFWYNLFHSYESIDVVSDVTGLVLAFSFVCFTSESKAKAFNLFYWIIQVCNICSLLFLLSYRLGINIGYTTVPYYWKFIDGGKNYYGQSSYIKWLVFALYKEGSAIRLCSIFNEPGALGTVCSLLFVARFSGSKAWEKCVSLVTVAFTFSLAGYLICFIFLFLHLLKKNPALLLVIMTSIAAIIMQSDFVAKNAQVYELLGRLVITKHGLAGNNRTTSGFNIVYSRFLASTYYLVGYGKGYPIPGGSLSFKTYVIYYGILGYAFWVGAWIFASAKNANKYCIAFLFLFFISLYQRPAPITCLYGYVLLFGGIEWIKRQATEKNGRNCTNEHLAHSLPLFYAGRTRTLSV